MKLVEPRDLKPGDVLLRSSMDLMPGGRINTTVDGKVERVEINDDGSGTVYLEGGLTRSFRRGYQAQVQR